MHNMTPEKYVEFIKPKQGDPTYTLLKAHLLFEEMLRAYLDKMLPSPEALKGSRLTFAQVLAVARALSPQSSQANWCWKAVADFNKIRNLLAHEGAQAELHEKLQAFVKQVVTQSGVPLPPPAWSRKRDEASGAPVGHAFLDVDLATVGLYFMLSALLGFPPPPVPMDVIA